MPTFVRPLATASALVLFLAGSLTATAAEDKKHPASNLPGVEGDYSIVKPAPEPEEAEDPNNDGKKRFKAGNWDVEVSGYIWYQIGTSSNGR